MNIYFALIIFILFWWALLATIFSYQLHKQNEDYARRLGERLPSEKLSKPDYIGQIRESILLPVNTDSLKLNFNRLRILLFRRLIPLKIDVK